LGKSFKEFRQIFTSKKVEIGLSTVNYCASGFCRGRKGDPTTGRWVVPIDDDRRVGFGEFVLFNPTGEDAKVNMTVYYEDKPPVQLPEFTVRAETNLVLVFPDMNMEVFNNCGYFGLKVVSTVPVIVNNIVIAGVDSEDVKYKGGVGDFLGNTRLSKVWYIADGLNLIFPPDKPRQPFDELEWINILNPMKRDAEVTMSCYYRDKTKDEFKFKVSAERVFNINIEGLVKPNKGYGAKLVSTEPIAVEQTRLIYSIKGIKEWGLNIHFTLPGVPAPLKWNEEIE